MVLAKVTQVQLGGGGCLRNSCGVLLFGFSYYYGIGTNLIAETRALLDGLRMAVKSRLPWIMIYTDSKILADLIHSNAHPPWKISRWWLEITKILSITKWQVQHIHREGNTVADFLASNACYTRSNIDYSNWRSLPKQARGRAVIDAAGLPSWRC